MKRRLALTATLSLAGCYAAPIALPPVRTSVSGGLATGRITAPLRRDTSNPIVLGTRRTDAVLDIRGSINPLQLLSPWRRTRYDLGLGYAASVFYGTDGYLPYVYHGPYVELGFFPWFWRLDAAGTQARFALYTAGGIAMLDTGNGTLTGTSVRLSGAFEVAPFVAAAESGTTHHHAFAYNVRGEYNVSLELAVGYEHVRDADFFTATLGLTFRLPAVTAVAAGAILDFNRIE